MNECRRIFDEKHHFLCQKRDEGVCPTGNQLAEFFRALTSQLGNHIQKCEPDVINFLQQKFSEFGWDVTRNASLRSAPPSPHDVLQFIERIRDYLIQKVSLPSAHLVEPPANKAQQPSPDTSLHSIEGKPAISTSSDKVSLGSGVFQARKGVYSMGLDDSDMITVWSQRSDLARIWKENDVLDAYEWVMDAPEERLPPRHGPGTRLAALAGALVGGCAAAHERLDRQGAAAWGPRGDGRRRAPFAALARKVLGLVAEDEEGMGDAEYFGRR